MNFFFVIMLVDNSETLVATSIFLFPRIGVATSIRSRDLALSTFATFLCRDLDSMSQLHFCCQPLCFLITASLLGCDIIQLSYAFKQVATQNCWSACFLVATWALGHDQVVSLIIAIPVATSKVCRDHSFNYPVATSFLSLNSFHSIFYFWYQPNCSSLF